METEELYDITYLKDLIAHVGGYLCYQCKMEAHELCCGHNDIGSCQCKNHNHDWEKAYESAFRDGVVKLKSLKIR